MADRTVSYWNFKKVALSIVMVIILTVLIVYYLFYMPTFSS